MFFQKTFDGGKGPRPCIGPLSYQKCHKKGQSFQLGLRYLNIQNHVSAELCCISSTVICKRQVDEDKVGYINRTRNPLEWNSQREVRLTPAYFLSNYKVQLLETVRKRETWFESCFQRLSTNLNSNSFFWQFWHYRLIRAPKQSTKLEEFFWITFWIPITTLWGFDLGNSASTFRERVWLKRKHTTNRTFAIFSLWDYECRLQISDHIDRVSLFTSKFVHWDLGGRNLVGSVVVRWVGISRKKHMRMQILEFSATQGST